MSAAHDGLLFVLSQPGSVPEEDFHAWYDEEHAPARAAFDEIDHATRWRARDAQEPTWLATYDVDLSLLDQPRYTGLREHRSPRELGVVAGLAHFERRTYRLLSERTRDGLAEGGLPGPMLVAVGLDVPPLWEAELHAWYEEEHVPLLLDGAGWRRTRRYELIDDNGPGAPRWLALHDLDGPEALGTPAYRHATSTSRRDRLMAAVRGRERREFVVHRRFERSSEG